MTPSSLAAGRIGCAALLAVALCRCGLSADGQGALPAPDGGRTSASSSSGAYGGSSSGSGSDDGSSGSSGGPGPGAPPGDDGGGGDDASDPAPLADAAKGDAKHADASPGDAAGDAASACATLMTCCPLLAALGSSAMSIMSCNEAASSGDESACETILDPFEGLGLCP